jgi:hypothetical protein
MFYPPGGCAGKLNDFLFCPFTDVELKLLSVGSLNPLHNIYNGFGKPAVRKNCGWNPW